MEPLSSLPHLQVPATCTCPYKINYYYYYIFVWYNLLSVLLRCSNVNKLLCFSFHNE